MNRNLFINISSNLIIVLTFFFITGCQQQTERKMPDIGEDSIHEINKDVDFNKAICVLHPTEGNKVTGIITFTRDGDNYKVIADLQNLPEGKHGFHIHEFGDCSANDGTSAGGHFNPENVEHAARTDSVRHVGDFGNIEADAEGNAHMEFTDSHISFSGKHSIIGRGIIIHANADDLKSQPTGNAGSRLACGVIGIAKE